MKVNDKIHGFLVTRVREVPEMDGTLTEMVYMKNGAKLALLRRPDTNKTFSISFKTVPENDTGVFHILEHSVLNGSKKYPVKEPFVELLKGSLQTFLNAMTFGDKTMFPVSSRNQKDFLNLVDVYMDAVLHPLAVKNPQIFYQEGWHVELKDKGAEPVYKGVVYNEMKGAYSSPDGVMEEEMSRLMFPDTCYGYDSGGDPHAIVDLSYEEFCAAHRRFYHPGAAYIFLDGEMDEDAVLSLLDSYLSEYGPAPEVPDVLLQSPRPYAERFGEYELAPGEEPEGKWRMSLGFMGPTFEEQTESLAVSILAGVLCGTNESPLKKALIDSGLCEDAYFSVSDGARQNLITLQIVNAAEGSLPAIRAEVERVLRGLVKDGIDRERLTAALNRTEFRLRERDYGTDPRGVYLAISVMESWLYGGDPAQNLSVLGAVEELRRALDTDYFEKLIEKRFLENPHTGAVVLAPSDTLAKRRGDDERERVTAAVAKMSDGEREALVRMNADLEARQSEPDSPESLATLPSVSVSDISPEPTNIPTEKKTVGTTEVIETNMPTAGIRYHDFYFNIADVRADEVPALALFASLFTALPTERHSVLELETRIKTYLGDISVTPYFTSVNEREGEKITGSRARAFMRVSCGFLAQNAGFALDLLREILFTTVFDRKEEVHTILKQMKIEAEELLCERGHSFASKRAAAAFTGIGALRELAYGYAQYEWMKKTEENFDTAWDALRAEFYGFCKRFFTKDRLTVANTGEFVPEEIKTFIDVFPSDGVAVPEYSGVEPFGAKRTGIAVPSQVSYAVAVSDLGADLGSMTVANTLITYEYLWTEVRVKGGAYGTGFSAGSGYASVYSYRDPTPVRSLSVYGGIGAFLRDFAASGEDVKRYVIGAIASSEPLLSPRATGDVGATLYLQKRTYEDRAKRRLEILATAPEDLAKLADLYDAGAPSKAVCVVGPASVIEAMDLDTVLKI